MDLRFAQLCAMVASFSGKKNVRFKDYMLFAEKVPVKKRQTAVQVRQIAQQVTGWFSGKRRNS